CGPAEAGLPAGRLAQGGFDGRAGRLITHGTSQLITAKTEINSKPCNDPPQREATKNPFADGKLTHRRVRSDAGSVVTHLVRIILIKTDIKLKARFVFPCANDAIPWCSAGLGGAGLVLPK